MKNVLDMLLVLFEVTPRYQHKPGEPRHLMNYQQLFLNYIAGGKRIVFLINKYDNLSLGILEGWLQAHGSQYLFYDHGIGDHDVVGVNFGGKLSDFNVALDIAFKALLQETD